MSGPEDLSVDPFTGKPVGVAGAAPSDVVEFLEQVMSSGPIDTITIYQDGLDGKTKIRVLAVKAIDPVELSATISRVIMTYAANRGRRTTFLVEAHAGTESRGMVPIVREIQPTLTSTAQEPPTEAGVLAMTMRHHETMARTNHVMSDAMAGHLTRELRDQRIRIKQLEAERDAVALRMRDVIVAGIDQDFMHAKNRQSLELRALAVQAALNQLPAIIQRFTANEVIDRVKSFATSLTPEQFARIGAALEPDQAQLLGALLTALQPKNILPAEVEKKE